MAKQPESDSFMDMFSRFGRDIALGERQRQLFSDLLLLQRDHGDAALHAPLTDRCEQMGLGDPLGGELLGDRGEEARARLVHHRAPAADAAAGIAVEAMRR